MPPLSRALLSAVVALWAAAGAGFAQGLVNPADRSDVVRFYHEVYLSADDYEDHHGWNGSVSGCRSGTLSDELHDDVIGRVNYFRAMAGLPAGITLSAELNAKCQQAALMMAYNNTLNHDPPSSWACYTADGAEAAYRSNLSSGINTPHYGPAAVSGQMQDDGANNKAVGHRRWILWSQAPDQMGHGSIPLTPIVGNPSQKNATMALWVFGESTAEVSEDLEFVAWPPAGYVPHQLAYARWSFGIPGADFSSATVTVSTDAGSISAPIVSRADRSGDPTIVFEPAGFPLSAAPASDQTYTVTVSDIADAEQDSYTYDVTVIDANSMPPVTLSGDGTGYVGYPTTVSFSPLTAAHSYQMRVFETAPGIWKADAESDTKVIDSTEADHALRTTSFAHTGSRSFHMTWDGESFEIDRTILPTTTSELHFEQRFRWVGNTTALIAEVAGSSGSWTEVWRRTGTLQGNASPNHWDSTWSSVSVPLGDFAGETIRLRFRYHRDPGGYGWFPDYPGDLHHEFGAAVDDIEISDSLEIATETVSTLPAGSTSAGFTPSATGAYQVQLRPQIANIWFGYGPPLVIEAVTGTPPVQILRVVDTGIDAAGVFYMDAEASGLSGLSVQTSSDGGQTWATDSGFQIPPITGSNIRISSSAPVRGSQLFRLTAP